MSLYLKYRPKSFADVVGQDHVVTTLEHAVKRDQIVHAYLFFGPRGTGKTSVARILAKILLIQSIKDETLQKQVLKSIDGGTLVDLIEIDAATNRQIDDIRDLKEKVQFAPSIASVKVYIIDEVHMMTKEAFNALLKTLEEPPPHAYFILATTALHKVPDTIQSRCQRFPFHQVGDDDIVRCLQNIADKEHIDIDRGALRGIARHANGGVRDAISLLDQLSSLNKITEQDVRLRIGESAEEYVEDLWEKLDQGDRKGALDIVSTLQEKGVSLEVFLRQLLSRARQEMHECIEKNTSTNAALHRIDSIFRALKDLRVAPVPAVALEVALLDMCGDSDSVQSIQKKEKKVEKVTKVKKVEKVEKASKVSDDEKSSDSVEKDQKKMSEKKDASFVISTITREDVIEAWSDVLSQLHTASIRMSLKDAHVNDCTDGCLTLAFSSSFHRDKVKSPAATHEVEVVLKEHFQQMIKLQCVLRDQGVADPMEVKEEQSVNMADAVAEIFGK